MNVIVVDTSIWVNYFKGSPYPQLDLALKEGRVYLPALVVSELLSAKLKDKQKKMLLEFLKELPLSDTSFAHWEKVGLLRSECLSKGITISVPDAHIAQCAIDLEGYLLSEDSIFKKIQKASNLKIEK